MFECMRPCDLGPAELVGGTDVAAKTQSHPPLPPLYFQADDVACLRPCATCGLPRRPYVSRPRPCGDGALWEIRSAGASTRAAPPLGHSAAAVPAGDDGCGISVFFLFQPGPGGNRRDHPELSLGLLESPFSMFHNMGPCNRPRGDPNACKHFGPKLDPGLGALHKAPGPYGEGFWEGDYGGGSGKAALLAHAEQPRKGLDPGALKINNRHTIPLCYYQSVLSVIQCKYKSRCAFGTDDQPFLRSLEHFLPACLACQHSE